MAEKRKRNRKRIHIMQPVVDKETIAYILKYKPFLNSISDAYSLAAFELAAQIAIIESDKKDGQEYTPAPIIQENDDE